MRGRHTDGIKSLIVATGAIAAFVSAAFLSPAFAAEAIRIGAALPLTGGYATTGTSVKDGIELAVEHINNTGGIQKLGGAKLEVMFADEQGNPRLAATEVERLISQQGAKIIIGAPSSGETLASSVIAERNKIPFFNLHSWADGIYTRNLKYLFGLPGPASTIAKFLAEATADLQKTAGFDPGRIVVVSNSTPFGDAVTEPLVPELKARGFNVVDYVKYDAQAPDLSPIVLKLKSLNADTIMGISHEADGLRFNLARAQLDFAPNVIAGISGYTQPSVHKALGKERMEGFMSKGVFALNLASADMRAPGWIQAVEAAKKKWGEEYEPTPLGFGPAYQGILLLRELLNAAGSLDGEALRKASLTLSIKKGSDLQVIPFETDLTFDEKGFSHGLSFVLLQYSPDHPNGQTVYPLDLATAKPVLKAK